MSGDLLKLHHVGVVVQDLEASVAWYVRYLGFERQHSFAFPGATAVFIAHGDVRLEVFQIDGASPLAPERQDGHSNLKIGGINHLAIAVANLDETVEDLKSKGVDIVSPPSDVPGGRGERFAFIRDNERMLIELFQPS